MKITLKLNGEKKDYTVGYINMLTVRRAMEIQEKIENLTKPTSSQLDMIVDFVVEAFDRQFTRDELYRGYPAKGFVNNMIAILAQITEMLVRTADDMGE